MNRRLFLGLDVGGTKIAAGLVELGEGVEPPAGRDYRIHGRRRLATADVGDGPKLLERVAELGEDLCREAGIGTRSLAGVGVALPGPVDPRTGRLVAAQSLVGLIDQPVVEFFCERWNRGVVDWVRADNDANAAAVGESRYGAGRGGRVVCYFTVGTGIGGSVVVNGQVFSGATGQAGEFGHVKLRESGSLCSCGDRGCLETLASGPSIARRAREALARGSGPLRDLYDRDPALVTGDRVAEAARAGDLLALGVWNESMADLGAGVATVMNLFNPDVVVIGGGVSRSADLLLPRVREVIERRAMPMVARAARIECAVLGDDVGVVGAAALAADPQIRPSEHSSDRIDR